MCLLPKTLGIFSATMHLPPAAFAQPAFGDEVVKCLASRGANPNSPAFGLFARECEKEVEAQRRTSFTGKDLMGLCQQFLSANPPLPAAGEAEMLAYVHASHCLYFIKGVADGMQAADALHESLSKAQPKIVCIPGSETVEQMVREVVAYGIRRPDVLPLPARLLASNAFISRYLCPLRGR